MTGAVENQVAAGIPAQRGAESRVPPVGGPALLEQAKGVLIFRYSIDEATALGVITLWAARSGTDIEAVARALVHDISQGEQRSSPQLVRWLEQQLRDTYPDDMIELRTRTTPVVVRVDHSYSALDMVVAAAREAARASVPLEITVDPGVAAGAGHVRALLLQQLDLAVELARAVEPGLVVRLPSDNPFAG